MRRRANSRAAVVEAGVDFQDVYHNRRRDNSVSRLASIRQASREEEEGVRGSLDEQMERSEKRESLDSVSTPRRVWRPGSKSGNQGSLSHAV
jgi:hypothetical protein